VPDRQPCDEPGDALARVTRAVLRAAPGQDALGVAELLWLSSIGPPPRESAEGAASMSFPGVTSSGESLAAATASGSAPGDAEPDADGRTPALGHKADDGQERSVAVPGGRQLLKARELVHALYPFRRQWPRGRVRRLDIDATVAEYGRTGELSPVFTPAPEPWFDLTLVVDSSTTMSVWQETADELGRLLATLNAFRTIRIRALDADLPAPELSSRRRRSPQIAPLPAPVPTGRRGLVLVFSDCTAHAWQSGYLWERLRGWAHTHVTALVNPLPTRIWRHVGVDLPAVRVSSPGTPGASNRGLLFQAPPEAGQLPVPTVTLSPRPVGHWARTLMRCSPEGCDALLLPPPGKGAPDRWGPPIEADGPQEPDQALAEAFRNRASTAAVRLAVLCSPFPELSVTLLRLIADELVPEATESDLAEFLVGGPVVPGKRIRTGGEESAWVHYRPAAREYFTSLLTSREAWQLYDALTRAVARGHQGRTRLYGHGGLSVGAGSALTGGALFADAPARVLELLGIALDPEPGEVQDDQVAQPPTDEMRQPPVEETAPPPKQPVEEVAQPPVEEAAPPPVDEAAPRPVEDDGHEALTLSTVESVQLAKGQTILLRPAGVPLTTARIQVSWQAARRRGFFRSRTQPVDLDISAVLFADRQPVDVVFFRHLISDDGSVQHTGDQVYGNVGESVLIDLPRVPRHITSIVVTLNSFTGQAFTDVDSIHFQLIDEFTERGVASYTLGGGSNSTAQFLAKLSRHRDDWSMTVIGAPANGRTFQDLMPAILPHL
jgi:stress response protein SCP2